MKTIYSLLAGIIFFAILFPSCTIEKRVYMPGYNVEWNIAKHKSKGVQSIANTESASSMEKNDDKQELVASPFSQLVLKENNNTIERTTASVDKNPVIIAKKHTAPVIIEF